MAKLGVPKVHKKGPFVGPQTFMNVPYSTDFSSSQAVILGVPFDGGFGLDRKSQDRKSVV